MIKFHTQCPFPGMEESVIEFTPEPPSNPCIEVKADGYDPITLEVSQIEAYMGGRWVKVPCLVSYDCDDNVIPVCTRDDIASLIQALAKLHGNLGVSTWYKS